MPTSRSESIRQSIEGSTTIRLSEGEKDPINRVDHYAVLSQVINSGIDAFFADEYSLEAVHQTSSLQDLEHTIKTNMHASILDVLETEPYTDHRRSLEESQRLRGQAGDRWSDLELKLLAGTGTYLSVTSELFHILNSRLGVEAASNENNWPLVDRIAKLNIHAFAAYQETYLRRNRFKNWSAFIDQLEIGQDDRVQFKRGFPANAPVTTLIATRQGTYKAIDFELDGSTPLSALKDIAGYDDAIGCPVTFRPDIVKKLWQLYATDARRIIAEPPHLSVGGSEA